MARMEVLLLVALDLDGTLLRTDGSGRLLDVGCGPGTITIELADRFEEAIGLDPDEDMLTAAAIAPLFQEGCGSRRPLVIDRVSSGGISGARSYPSSPASRRNAPSTAA
ncbi:class I SAM-dependent methyltransferase [Sorangium sp. So ce388]|uniref:class I SAM-dependent methyltransferase n=1 Tax=Sorangium sp. So ce388 TaxID=3133309 RepID=UPI003F5B3D90